MGKQSKILDQILCDFSRILYDGQYEIKLNQLSGYIQAEFKKSLNKKDIIRRILNQHDFNNDEKIQLLKLILKENYHDKN